ncbi:MAG: hypothetical protein AB7P14_22275 [Blastocatellales bacterium]
MSKMMKFIWYAIALWVMASFVVFGFGNNVTIQVLRGFWPFIALLFGFFTGIFSLVVLFSKKNKIQPILSLIISIATLLSFKSVLGCGAWINFQLHRNSYEQIVQKVLAAGTAEERKVVCSDKCRIYDLDTISLSFDYSVGFLNWTQIVYDPQGVKRQKKPGDFHPNPPYDTYLVKSEPMTKDWYLCYFID